MVLSYTISKSYDLLIVTRMHSSRMCTIRSSSHVYPSMHCTGHCVSQHTLGRGVSVQGGVCPGGCLPRVCVYPSMHWEDTPLWTE